MLIFVFCFLATSAIQFPHCRLHPGRCKQVSKENQSTDSVVNHI